MNNYYDVCIIGGGIAGLTSAYELSTKSNLKICVIERDKIGGVAKSWKNEDNIFVEHSWRGFPIVYKNLCQIMEQIPYKDTNCLSNLAYSNVSIGDKYISENKIDFTNYLLVVDAFVLSFFSFIHILSRGTFEINATFNNFLSERTCKKIGYVGFGLDPNVSTITDFIKSLCLLLYNHFQVGEKINIKNGVIKSYYFKNFEYKNFTWNKFPNDGDYNIIKKNNSRYYITEYIYFEIIIRPIQFQALTTSTYEGLFKPWKTFLEKNKVDFYLNTEIVNVTKNDNKFMLMTNKQNHNLLYCKNIIMANGFQSIDKLLKEYNIVSKKLYTQLNSSLSTTIIATTCSDIKETYSILTDSPIIFSYQIINKIFINSNDVPKGTCTILFNIHCLMNDSYTLTLPHKKISELNIDEYKNEMIFNLKLLCDKNQIKIENINYIYVSDEIIFDGKKAHTKYDNGYFITKTSNNVLKPQYKEIPNIYFAGHDVYNSINVRSMESACETGKVAAINLLKNENINHNINVYKMEKIEGIYFSVTQNILLFVLLCILFIISIKFAFECKSYSKKIYIIIIFLIVSYVLVCFYQLLLLCYDIYHVKMN